jgi:hypothetical protein
MSSLVCESLMSSLRRDKHSNPFRQNVTERLRVRIHDTVTISTCDAGSGSARTLREKRVFPGETWSELSARDPGVQRVSPAPESSTCHPIQSAPRAQLRCHPSSPHTRKVPRNAG